MFRKGTVYRHVQERNSLPSCLGPQFNVMLRTNRQSSGFETVLPSCYLNVSLTVCSCLQAFYKLSFSPSLVFKGCSGKKQFTVVLFEGPQFNVMLRTNLSFSPSLKAKIRLCKNIAGGRKQEMYTICSCLQTI